MVFDDPKINKKNHSRKYTKIMDLMESTIHKNLIAEICLTEYQIEFFLRFIIISKINETHSLSKF